MKVYYFFNSVFSKDQCGNLEQTKKEIVLKAVNTGQVNVYIEKPYLEASKKIVSKNNERSTYIIDFVKVDDQDSWPVKLEPGEVFRYKFDLISMASDLSKFKDSDYLKIVAKDTMEKEFKSKKIHIRTLRKEAAESNFPETINQR